MRTLASADDNVVSGASGLAANTGAVAGFLRLRVRMSGCVATFPCSMATASTCEDTDCGLAGCVSPIGGRSTRGGEVWLAAMAAVVAVSAVAVVVAIMGDVRLTRSNALFRYARRRSHLPCAVMHRQSEMPCREPFFDTTKTHKVCPIVRPSPALPVGDLCPRSSCHSTSRSARLLPVRVRHAASGRHASGAAFSPHILARIFSPGCTNSRARRSASRRPVDRSASAVPDLAMLLSAQFPRVGLLQ